MLMWFAAGCACTLVRMADHWTALLEAFKGVRAAWPARGWSWDTRLSCVTSSFVTEVEAEARAAVRMALPNEWTPGTIGRAAPGVRELAEKTGGLRAGQFIFSSAPIGVFFGYGLWWPWGDAMTTSVRIGLGGAELRQEVHERLRDVFGVTL
jgi:hypothetical protein